MSIASTGFNCEGEQIHVSAYVSDPQFNRAGCIPGYTTIINRKPYGYLLKQKKWMVQERKG